MSEDECVWADVSGRDYQRDGTGAGVGYDEQTWSVSGGGQVKVAKDVVLGFAGGFEQGSASTSSGADADTDRVYGGVTLKHTSGPWLLAAAIYGGKGWSDTTRYVNFGGLAMQADGEQDIEHLNGRVRAAYQAGGNALYVKPMVDLEVTQLWLGSVQETGGPAALSIADSSETIFSAALRSRSVASTPSPAACWCVRSHASVRSSTATTTSPYRAPSSVVRQASRRSRRRPRSTA